MNEYRTHTCGELRGADIGTEVKVSGWVNRKRDHGGVFFIDLRDHYGVVQVVTSQEDASINYLSAEHYQNLTHISYESVISIKGEVVRRSEETINEKLPTGEVEIVIKEFEVLSTAEPLPMVVNSDQTYPEDIRLKHRYLDLRREKMHQNIMLRSNIVRKIRSIMHALGFTEFHTPILTASSPEGARDFLVPSRLHNGKFYALPQAPQQFKQLTMASGFDKYFQIAKCFRDEDLRADRTLEFEQLDIEMSFVTQEDIFQVVEKLLTDVFTEFAGSNYQPIESFVKIPYKDAMEKYGCDKPDLRNPLILSDATDMFSGSGFSLFNKAIEQGKVVKAIPAPGTSQKPRSFFDKMISFAQQSLGAKGLGYVTFVSESEGKGPIAKFLSSEQISRLRQSTGCAVGDSVFFACDELSIALNQASKVRDKLGAELDLLEKNVYKFCWIVDFPFYEWNDETNRIDFSHNPFSMPQGGMEALQKAEGDTEALLQLKAYQYDIVCNGIELSSGAIRNHKPELMYKAFEIAGYSTSDVEEKFGALLNAFRYGAPPHGGIAPGIDRIVMMLANEPNIREVILFPFNQNGQDLMMNAPLEVGESQLQELGIKIVEDKAEEKVV